ncbi:DUF4231 domain-containing protein [Kitasatospora sp. NPDC004669]|uniref:DUF4231 domain-containing protein n=1 Tax=Kitasatospora sp. NPDC004669 TaxID=3154555 RepID=UPI0033A131F8
MKINLILIPLGLASFVAITTDEVRDPPGDWDAEYISKQKLELELAQERKRLQAVSLHLDPQSRRHIYKETVPVSIERYQRSGRRYRAVHNTFQSVIIVGSLATSILAGMDSIAEKYKWVTVGVSFSVGISAGFTGYFKYRERSFYLQQTADAIEEELNGVNLRTGRYRSMTSDDEAIAEFTERVEALQSEQRKRQQQLDQPAQPGAADQL